jgi:ribonucleoside-triphosphate reductase
MKFLDLNTSTVPDIPVDPAKVRDLAIVRRRDGSIAPFDAARITKAIARAGQATREFEKPVARDLTDQAVANLKETFADAGKLVTIEDIQDEVEDVLLGSPYRKTARAYIVYRDQHAKIREGVINADLETVDKYLERLDWQVRENSNMTYSLQGLNNYLSSSLSECYWLNRIYPPEIRDAHESGIFHIHDLNQLSVYCVGWDLSDLLAEGFRGVSGKIEAKPAKHFRSALGQIVNFFYTLQGEAAGAQAFSSFDTLLAPFIHYDGLDEKAVYQALQEFVFNINVPTRVGFQTPFTNITLDLLCPSHFARQPVIIGGEAKDKRYGDFQEEMNIFNKALFRVMSEGDARGRILTFPIPTINITKNFDWENPNLDGLWEMTAKYGVPYFSNFVNSDMDPEDARSMCCRLRIDNTQLEKRGGGLFGAHPLTGSIGVVTVNLPRLAYEATDLKDFQAKLGEAMDMARNALEIKRKFLERLTDSNLYPYTTYYLRHIKQRWGEYWKNHFSTVGLIGMNEAVQNLLGEEESIATSEGHQLAVRTLDFMRERLIGYQQDTGHHYNLEATPAEGTSYRLAQKDKKRHPEIRVANEAALREGEGTEPFYTNSSHLPVNFSDDMFEVLDHQDDLQTRYTGGTVLHLFLGERLPDPVSVRNLVRKIAENYHLPYFSLTPTFSVCPEHGYLSGHQTYCPKCGAQTEVYSRVVGYLRPVSQWNAGKQEEFGLRKGLGCDPDQMGIQPTTVVEQLSFNLDDEG